MNEPIRVVATITLQALDSNGHATSAVTQVVDHDVAKFPIDGATIRRTVERVLDRAATAATDPMVDAMVTREELRQ